MQPVSWDCAQEGELSAANMKQKLESMGYSVAAYSYPPGTFFPPHTHNVDKIDGVLSGRFRMTMGEESVTLAPGDMLAVPRGAVHSAEIIGNEPVLSLNAVRP